MVEAINALPDDTIEGLSEYDPSDVSLKGNELTIIRRGDPLSVNFPNEALNSRYSGGEASFKYKTFSYKIKV